MYLIEEQAKWHKNGGCKYDHCEGAECLHWRVRKLSVFDVENLAKEVKEKLVIMGYCGLAGKP